MKVKIGFVVLVVVLATSLILSASTCWAQAGVTQANLEKIKQGKFSEAEVKSLLGEPKKTETSTKAKRGGRELHEIATLYYDVGGKEVRIYVDRTWGFVTSVIEP